MDKTSKCFKGLRISIGLLSLIPLIFSCKSPSLDGKFYFKNTSSAMVRLKCYNYSFERFNKEIPPDQTVSFSNFLINSHYSIPDQMDSIIIESNGKVFIESCPFKRYPSRECDLGERSLFNHKAYERVEKRRSLAKDYYYYFTDADLSRLK